MMPNDLLLRNARWGLRRELVDVLVTAGRVAAIEAGLVPARAEVVDLDGRTLLPGLWDHHVHADQHALRTHWLDLSGARDAEAVVALVTGRLAAGVDDPALPLVGYGFRDAVWPRPGHRRDLDAVSRDRALVMVSGDLHQGWLNTAALRAYGFAADHPGRLDEHAWFPVLERVSALPTDVVDRWVAGAMGQAAARGVVGVVDFEKADLLTVWPRRHRRARLDVRVRTGVWPEHLDGAIAAGRRTGDVLPDTDGLVSVGNLKVISDGSLNTRTAYCFDAYPGRPTTLGTLSFPPAELVPLMGRAWQHGIASSIHAIGDHANTLALDAFATVGAPGTIEHAQQLVDGDLPRFAALGVAASIQPEHAHDDRDVADRLWPGRTGRSFPYGALLRHGARLLLGSDAPVAPLDPLLTIAAAVSRSRDGRTPWHPEHELPLAVALAGSTGTGRTEPQVGDVADLAVVDLDLASADADALRTAGVAGTMVAGRWTHRDGI